MNIERVWSQYRGSLKGFLHKNIADPDDVDDLLQEILIKSYQHLPQLRDEQKLKSWLFQITKNSITDFYRRQNTSVQMVEKMTENEPWHSAPELEIMQQLSECIVPFINALPAEEAALLTAIEIEGLSQKAYAQRLAVNYSTLKSRVQKSRDKLRGLFSECCTFSIDESGQISDYQAKRRSCSGC